MIRDQTLRCLILTGRPFAMGKVSDGVYAGSLLGSTSSKVNFCIIIDMIVMASIVANCCPRLTCQKKNDDDDS